MDRLNRLLFFGPYKEFRINPTPDLSREWFEQQALVLIPSLSINIPKEIEHAGILLHALRKGIINTWEETPQRNIAKVFLTTSSKIQRPLAVVGHNEIYIPADIIYELAHYSPDKMYPNHAGHYGKIEEYVELIGAEEEYHNLHPEFAFIPANAATTQLEHDSHVSEHLALVWELTYAKRHHFSKTTIDFLQKRLDDVITYLGT